jgi:hypothetical protein
MASCLATYCGTAATLGSLGLVGIVAMSPAYRLYRDALSSFELKNNASTSTERDALACQPRRALPP